MATTVIGNPDEQIWKLFSTFDKAQDRGDHPNKDKKQTQQQQEEK